MAKSQGPDKLKNGYLCYTHHSGVRTFDSLGVVGNTGYIPIHDYSCCCHPCQYIKADFDASTNWHVPGSSVFAAARQHCCSCNPRIIVANWDASYPDDGCNPGSFKTAMGFSTYNPDGESFQSVQYGGTIAGHPIVVTLSPFQTTPTGLVTIDGSGCRWTMHIANGDNFSGGYSSVTEFIDHHSTTCLKTPSFGISGVSGFSGSGGVVTLSDYDASKVAFNKRDLSSDVNYVSGQSNQEWAYSDIMGIPRYSGIVGSQIFFPAKSGDVVSVPTGIISPPYVNSGYDAGINNSMGIPWIQGMYPTGVIPFRSKCPNVPKFLCVENFETGSEANTSASRYREYVYDTGFFPIQRMEFHPSYTGIQYLCTGNAIAKWIYTPVANEISGKIPSDDNEKYIFLYETYVDEVVRYSGNMDLVTNSGVPKVLFTTIDNFPSTYTTERDHVWGGGAYYRHPAIHYSSDPLNNVVRFEQEGEEFYWFTGSGSRTLYTGGNRTFSTIYQGDGSSSGCDIRALGYYESPGFVDKQDVKFIRPGRCSCWEYHCSNKCRCVPKKLCLKTIEVMRYGPTGSGSTPTSTYNNFTLEWDGSSCWTANGVSLCVDKVPTKGYSGPETYTPVCGLNLSGSFFTTGIYSYSFDTKTPITCDHLNMAHSFVHTVKVGDTGVASMYASTSPFFSSCTSKNSCDTASPCYLNCGSHPDSLTFNVKGYSVSGVDMVSGGEALTGICIADFTLNYQEDYIIVSEDPLDYYVLCYYKGYMPCGTGMAPIEAFLGNGGLPMLSFNGYSLDSQLEAPQTRSAFESYSESCNPYFFSGIMRETSPFSPFWICDSSCQAFRVEMVITE